MRSRHAAAVQEQQRQKKEEAAREREAEARERERAAGKDGKAGGDAKKGAAAAKESSEKAAKERDPDPDGAALAGVADPLGEAVKLVRMLQQHAGGRLRTHVLAFEVRDVLALLLKPALSQPALLVCRLYYQAAHQLGTVAHVTVKLTQHSGHLVGDADVGCHCAAQAHHGSLRLCHTICSWSTWHRT